MWVQLTGLDNHLSIPSQDEYSCVSGIWRQISSQFLIHQVVHPLFYRQRCCMGQYQMPCTSQVNYVSHSSLILQCCNLSVRRPLNLPLRPCLMSPSISLFSMCLSIVSKESNLKCSFMWDWIALQRVRGTHNTTKRKDPLGRGAALSRTVMTWFFSQSTGEVVMNLEERLA